MDCYHCGRDISPNASFCPHCGETDQSGSSYKPQLRADNRGGWISFIAFLGSVWLTPSVMALIYGVPSGFEGKMTIPLLNILGMLKIWFTSERLVAGFFLRLLTSIFVFVVIITFGEIVRRKLYGIRGSIWDFFN